MFTGIVQKVCPINCVENRPHLTEFSILLPQELQEGLRIGSSIAIDGVCLTVVELKGEDVFFHVIEETSHNSTLNNLYPGRQVNVERSVRLGEEIGGHLVSGHIFGTASIESIHQDGDRFCLRIQCPKPWIKYLLPKGFVAIDGVSLTVGQVQEDGIFTVYLIPETLRSTIFRDKKAGDLVNIELHSETQAIVSTVERYLARTKNFTPS